MANRLTTLIAGLKKMYGAPPPLHPKNAFQLAIYESVAYLVDDGKRLATFRSLEKLIGLTPEKIAAASTEKLTRAIEGGGMKPPMRVLKLQEAAALALEV